MAKPPRDVVSEVMSAMGKKGGRTTASRMTAAERREKARIAGKASAKSRAAKEAKKKGRKT